MYILGVIEQGITELYKMHFGEIIQGIIIGEEGCRKNEDYNALKLLQIKEGAL